MDWNFVPGPGLGLELPTGAGADHDIPLGGSPFPPIADYALLSNCEVCALVAPGGNIEWLSLPQMDGPSVFSAIVDRHAGRFRAGPLDRTVPAFGLGVDGVREEHLDRMARGLRLAARGTVAPRRQAVAAVCPRAARP